MGNCARIFISQNRCRLRSTTEEEIPCGCGLAARLVRKVAMEVILLLLEDNRSSSSSTMGIRFRIRMDFNAVVGAVVDPSLLLSCCSFVRPRDLQRLIHSEHQESCEMDCVSGIVVGAFDVATAGLVVLELESAASTVVAAVVVIADEDCSRGIVGGGFSSESAITLSGSTVIADPPQTCTIGYKTLFQNCTGKSNLKVSCLFGQFISIWFRS